MHLGEERSRKCDAQVGLQDLVQARDVERVHAHLLEAAASYEIVHQGAVDT